MSKILEENESRDKAHLEGHRLSPKQAQEHLEWVKEDGAEIYIHTPHGEKKRQDPSEAVAALEKEGAGTFEMSYAIVEDKRGDTYLEGMISSVGEQAPEVAGTSPSASISYEQPVVW